MIKHYTAIIKPIGKPRMTRQDKWKQRPCVMRYRAFCNELRLQVKVDPAWDVIGVSWVAYLPMFPSWSNKKRESLKGQLHRDKPDRDNIDKAILDALFKDDSGIATGQIEKRWDDGNGPRLEIELETIDTIKIRA